MEWDIVGGFSDHVRVIEVRVGQVVRWFRKQTRNFSLMMHHVAAEDSGMYECNITMESGKKNISSWFQVNVRTGKDYSKSSSTNRTPSSTGSANSPSPNSTKKHDDYQFYFIPFLCVCVIMVVLVVFCIYLVVKVIQLQRDSTAWSKPQDDTDQKDPLSPKSTEPTYVTAVRSEVVDSPYSSLNPTRPALPTRPEILPARNKSQRS
uniref:Ig-like domain-containing protein n=1 Tax=Eptatretus burgeri TaxID=7764 RepID=A0A8C4QYV5_EPTBU